MTLECHSQFKDTKYFILLELKKNTTTSKPCLHKNYPMIIRYLVSFLQDCDKNITCLKKIRPNV